MIRTACWSLLTVLLAATVGQAQDDGSFVIRGRVLDAAAKPVPGAKVRLLAAGFGGFDVDEKTVADAEGRFKVTAPKTWTHMDASQRQELAVVATEGKRIALVQFNRNSAPPRSEIEIGFPKTGGAKITVLTPDRKPLAGAKVKIAGLVGESIHVELTEAEIRQLGANAKKKSFGYVVASSTVGLPPDLQIGAGTTDAMGSVTLENLTAAHIGAVTVDSNEFGEQSVGHYQFGTNAKSSDWPQRIVLKKTGRIAGQLTSPIAEAVANREVTLTSFEQNFSTNIFQSCTAKVVTDRDGRFEATKMVAGSVRFDVKFDPKQPTRPPLATSLPELKAGETLNLKIDLKPAVRVQGVVLDADSKKPISDVEVRAYFGNGFESTTSDAQGKFAFWMAPGETGLHVCVPEGYLAPLRPSDYFDSAKRQQSITIFKVPDAKTFESPPVLLQRAANVRGVVVDDRGKPVPAAEISSISMIIDRRSGQPKPREVAATADERGEFTIAGIDPREPLRLRVKAKEAAKVVTIAKPGSEAVRVVVSPSERFHLSGLIADAQGKPVADALLEIWHRDWRPPPGEAEPKKLNLPEPIRADAEGRFKTPPLNPDGHYRFTIRAAGAKTADSPWLDATKPEALAPQQLVVTRLGGLSGLVRDRAGKPVADARISLFAREMHIDTAANKQGEFTLEAPAGKPFCVVVRHPEFRADGMVYEKTPPSIRLTLSRLDEPAEKLTRCAILAKEDREKMLAQLLEPLRQRLAKSKQTQEQMSALQSLTGVTPDFVTDFLEKHPLASATYTEMLHTQVAMKNAARNADEAEELIGRMKPGAQKSMAYGMLADALPDKARARKLEILAESLVQSRAEKSPEFRAITLGQVGKRLFALGEKDRATALLREGEKVAAGLSTSAYAGFARANFATDLALIDLPAALALMKDLKDKREFARHHGNTAHRIAATQPAEAVRILNMIPPPEQNEFNQRELYAIRVCYRMAKADLKAALQLAQSIGDVPSRAHALGVMAQGIAAADPKRALDLMRRAYLLLEEDATRPAPTQLVSPLSHGTVAAALTLIAEQIDPNLVRECLWRSVALQKPYTENPEQIWRYTHANAALAMAAARYHGKLAELLVPEGKTVSESRELQLARFLANPERTLAADQKTPPKSPRDGLQLIIYLATDDSQMPRLILNTLGMWRADVEDIDF